MVANNAISSGQIAADLKLRDQTLVQAQTQVDQLAATLSSSLSDQTTAGTAVAGPPAGFSVDTSNMLPGNTINLTYTDNATNTQQQISIVNVTDPSVLPLPNAPNANPQVIGVNFSGGMASIVSQLNAALGSSGLQFSNPSGTTLSVIGIGIRDRQCRFDDDHGFVADKRKRRSCRCSPTAIRSTPARSPASGSQMTGYAGRITVNPALLNNPSDLTVYSTSPPTAAGDTTRSDYLFSQLTNATFSYSPQTGLGSTAAPFTGTMTSYLQQFLSQQGNAATQATQLQQGQDVVVSTLAAEIQLDVRRQHRHRNVEPDRAAEFLCRQCSCHVGGSKHDEDPAAGSNVRRSKMSISSINYGASVLGQSVQTSTTS